MHCRVIFNWLSFLEMWLAYVLSVSFPRVPLWTRSELRVFNFTLNSHQFIGKLSGSMCVCVCAEVEERILDKNSPMWFHQAAGTVTFEPAYDALILHMSYQQTSGCFTPVCAPQPPHCGLFKWCVFRLFLVALVCLWGVDYVSMCCWEWNPSMGSMYLKLYCRRRINNWTHEKIQVFWELQLMKAACE